MSSCSQRTQQTQIRRHILAQFKSNWVNDINYLKSWEPFKSDWRIKCSIDSHHMKDIDWQRRNWNNLSVLQFSLHRKTLWVTTKSINRCAFWLIVHSMFPVTIGTSDRAGVDDENGTIRIVGRHYNADGTFNLLSAESSQTLLRFICSFIQLMWNRVRAERMTFFQHSRYINLSLALVCCLSVNRSISDEIGH